MSTNKKPILDETRRVWEPRYGSALTDEQAREIVANAVGFFETLARWAREADNTLPRPDEDYHD